ncbi:hypothetical protein EPO34_00070 [Patescibacteria group bacterium]|nr:MAG: hypothetical protein EPO34_00070 [Patescibacteria group bacterium]
MTEKDIVNLLHRVKDAPELGGGFDDARAERCMNRFWNELGVEAPKPVPYGLREYADYALFVLSHAVARPLAVGTSVFALIFGGWVTTVNASFSSLPGDVLYPVKLATERMQLTLASSGVRRARLHADFASRRLQEVGELSVSSRPGREAQLKAAVEGFTQEMVSAKEQLDAVGIDSPSEAVDLALVLDQKADEYQALLTQGSSGEPSVMQEVADAQAAVDQVNSTAVETLVNAQEQNGGDPRVIERNFQSQLTSVRSLIALSTARLTAIKEAISKADALDADRGSRIAQARQAVTSQEKPISEATNAFAVGGYRRAFEALDAVEQAIDGVQPTILELELSLTAPAPESPPNF